MPILCFSQNASIQNEKPQPASSEAIQDPNISTFRSAIEAAGLSELFKGTGPFTAFIPTNKAFEKFGKDKLNELLKPENKDRLIDLLTYHITTGKYLAQNLKTRTYRAINGKNLNVTVENGVIKVNNATIIRADMVGPNGVIHEIDTVLVP